MKYLSDYYRNVFSIIALTIVMVVVFLSVLLKNNLNVVVINRQINDQYQPSDAFSGVSLYSNLTNVDQTNQNFRIHFDFRPKGSFLDSSDPLERLLSQEVSISIDSDTQSYYKDGIIVSRDIEFPISSGTPQQYPFDFYQSYFFIQASSLSISSNASISSTKIGVPLSMSLANNLLDWEVDIQLIDITGDFSLLKGTLNMTRATIQKVFSLFIVLLMWLLSAGVFLLSLSLYYGEREIEAPVIGVATTLLFALPAIRALQPGVPPIGCTSDVFGFFWNMALVTAAALILLWKYARERRNNYTKLSTISTSQNKGRKTALPQTEIEMVETSFRSLEENNRGGDEEEERLISKRNDETAVRASVGGGEITGRESTILKSNLFSKE